MSADKFQTIREALADAFNAEDPISTNTQSSHPTFDHKTFSDAFSAPHLNEAAANGSPVRVDHASLTGMFSKPPAEIQTAFDEEFADILSDRPQLVTDIQTPRPGFDHQGVAEILSEPPAISANIRPSQPCFDHQVLVEILTDARADPIDPPSSPLSFGSEPPPVAPFSSHIEQGEPTAQGFAISSLATTAEDARPPRARSLLAKLHQMFSTREEPVPSDAQKDALSASFAGQIRAQEPAEQTIRPPAQDAQQQHSLLAEGTLPSSGREREPLRPSLPSDTAVESGVAVTRSADASNAHPPYATRAAAGISSVVSGTADSSPLTNEPRTSFRERPSPDPTPALLSPTTAAGSGLSPAASRQEAPRLASSTPVENLEPSATPVAQQARAETVVTATRLPETPRWPSATIAPDSTKTDSQSFVFQNESVPVDFDHAPPQQPVEVDVAAVVADATSGRLHRPELPVSPMAESTTLHAAPDREGVAAEPAFALSARAMTPTEAEGASPQIAGSLLAALHVLNAKPSPPLVEKKPSRAMPAGQPDHAGNSATAASHPTAADDGLSRSDKSPPTERPLTDSTDAKPAALASIKEPSNSPVPGRTADISPMADAVAGAAAIDTESAVARAQQAKLLLSELDLGTAIHLRWVMRDIRSRRTKLAPVSAKDLAALVDLGFVELREDLPRLTGLGILALD